MNELMNILTCPVILAFLQPGNPFWDIRGLDSKPMSGSPLLWLTAGAWSIISLAYLAFMVWMLFECARSDPDRGLWIWIILFFQPLGAFIYFLARWHATNQIQLPKSM